MFKDKFEVIQNFKKKTGSMQMKVKDAMVVFQISESKDYILRNTKIVVHYNANIH